MALDRPPNAQGERPHVSILIPNYNNGAASTGGDRPSLIETLLDSLHRTLEADPTPLEILVDDDGSTDDGPETLRRWAGRRWRGGQPMLDVRFEPHVGVLSVVANRLVRRARGEVLVRLDGDVEPITAGWAAALASRFKAWPAVGVIGPKQLRDEGRTVHAFGDTVLHPSGYGHHAEGLPRQAVDRPMAVEHVMGCFYAFRRTVFEAVGGFDETLGRGQTVDFGLAARLAGFDAMAIPEVEFIHRHHLRYDRSSRADHRAEIAGSMAAFERKWGFSRVAPDLEQVASRWGGTPLVRGNPFVEAAATARAGEGGERFDPHRSRWLRYERDEPLQRRCGYCVEAARAAAELVGSGGNVVQLEAGDGLLLHLLALAGVRATGFERGSARAGFAETCLSRAWAGDDARPRVLVQPEGRRTPAPSGSASLVLLLDVIDEHANPPALIAEAARLLAPGGRVLLTSTRRRFETNFTGDPWLREPMRPTQVLNLLRDADRFEPETDVRDVGPGQPLAVLARRGGGSWGLTGRPGTGQRWSPDRA